MVLLLVASRSAEACSPPPILTLSVDPSLPDRTAPAQPVVVSVRVTRGYAGEPAIDCSPLGVIGVDVRRPASDLDSDETVGYRWRTVDGTLPDDLFVYEEAPPEVGPHLSLVWDDGAVDLQEPFAVTLELVPVDLAGNEGLPVAFFVQDPGRQVVDPADPSFDDDPGGVVCGTAPASSGWLALGVLGFGIRRRR